MARAGRKRKPRQVTLARTEAPQKLQGDHGPQTAAQMAGAVIVPIEGDNPNHVGKKVRQIHFQRYHYEGWLTIRQFQAAREISEAHEDYESLSSGNSDYARPIVDTSERPDAFTDAQAAKMGRWTKAIAGVPKECRAVVDAVCVSNIDLPREHTGLWRLLQRGLDGAAWKLGY